MQISKRIALLAGFLSMTLCWTGAVIAKPSMPLKTFKDCDACSEMVVLPAGQYMMGATEEEYAGQPKNFEIMYLGETPRHSVQVRSFALAKTHITREQFAVFASETSFNGKGCYIYKRTDWAFDPEANWENPGLAQTDSDPVVCVSWDDAQLYLAWLNTKLGETATHHRYRLPTEEEWEYAARAGTTTPMYWGTSRQDQCRYENTRDQTAKVLDPDLPLARCSDHFLWTSPVGSFFANPWGFSDMLGNALQWTSDCSSKTYRGDGLLTALPKSTCKGRLLRGSSWASIVYSVRAAMRGGSSASKRDSITGFRVASDSL